MRWLKTSSNPEHWSKDYVEHLRTVHFWLMAISVGVLVILTAKPNLQKARNQIEELLEIKSWWSGDQLEARFPGISIEHADYSLEEPALLFGETLSIPLFAEASDDSGVTLKVPPDGWYWCRHQQRLSPEVFPNSIRDLRVWWDELGRGYKLLRVNSISPHVNKASGVVPGLPMDAGGSEYRHGKDMLFKAVNFPHSGNKIVVLRMDSCNVEHASLTALNGIDTYEVHVIEREGITVDQRTIYGKFEDLPPGRFDDTFKDLISAAGTEDLSLQFLEPWISEEAAKGSTEFFEKDGLKIPVATHGLIVLLCVQLYLWLYLKRLSNKLQPDDPGWDTPWIAMDQGWIAQLCVFVTFIVLPVAAALAASQAVGVNLKDWHGWWKQQRGVIAAFELATSLVLGVCSWMYRPRMKEPKMPPWMYP